MLLWPVVVTEPSLIGRQKEEGEPEGPWLTLFLCSPPLTAASQTKCAQQKVFETQWG